MSSPLHRLLTLALSVVLFSAPIAQSFAQPSRDGAAEPLVVVSIAPTDELLGDIGYLTEAAGAGDVGRLVALMAAPYTAGLDKGKPSGMVLTLAGPDNMEGVGFVPVKDLDVLLGTLQDQLGEPEDVGNGIMEVATDRPQSMFVKESKGWAFFTNKKKLLADLPKNPAKLLGDLPENYTVAMRLNVAAIPAELREKAIQEMRKGLEEGLDDQVDDQRQAELARKIGESYVESVVSLVEDAEYVTIGWQVDAVSKATYVDVSVTATAGTQLAKDMAAVKEGKSAFTGVLHPDAAVTFLAATPCTQSDVDQGLALLDVFREEAMKGIDEDDNLANDKERATAKRIVGDLMDLAEETTKAAKLDCGGCLVLKPQAMTAVLGGFLADGEQLEASLREIHALAQSKDNKVPNVHFAAETHRGVTLHTAAVPLPGADQDARDTLGDPMEIVIGTGEKSAYVAFGKNAKAVLAEVLDASAEQADEKVPPMQMYIALTPILEFAASVDDNPLVPSILDTLKQSEGKDRISISVIPVKRGVSMRLSMDEGILATLGEAGRALAPLMQGLR